MIILSQAIELATKAHEGQWRNPEPLDHSKYFYILNDYPDYENQGFFINENGFKISINDTEWVIQKPYITHPLAVMDMMNTDEEKIVAILHDVIEDTEATLHSNINLYWIMFEDTKYLLNGYVWAALYCTTQPNDNWDKFKEKGCYQSYAGYIHNLATNKLATKVKIADIVHNLSGNPSDHAKQKYLKAIPILLKSL